MGRRLYAREPSMMIPGFKTIMTSEELLGPLVYAFCNEEEVLYVGMSLNASRPLSTAHKPGAALLLEGAVLSFCPCETYGNAGILEGELIAEYAPKFNKSGVNLAALLKKLEWKRNHNG